MDKATLDFYAANAYEVAKRYEAAPSLLGRHFSTSFAPGGRILDIGCGSGRDLADLRLQGYQPYGVDGTLEFVQLAHFLLKLAALDIEPEFALATCEQALHAKDTSSMICRSAIVSVDFQRHSSWLGL